MNKIDTAAALILNTLKINSVLDENYTRNITDLSRAEYIDGIYKLISVKKINIHQLVKLNTIRKIYNMDAVLKEMIPDEKCLVINKNSFPPIILNGIFSNKYNENNIQEYLTNFAILEDRYKVECDINYAQATIYAIVSYMDKYIMEKNIKPTSTLLGNIDFPSGHMNTHNIRDNLLRELNEEIGIIEDDIQYVKYLYCIPPGYNAGYANAYHFGLVYRVDLKPETIIRNCEPDKHKILMRRFNTVFDSIDNDFSSWCRYVVCESILK